MSANVASSTTSAPLHEYPNAIPLFCEDRMDINYNDTSMALIKKKLVNEHKSATLTLQQYQQLKSCEEYKHTLSYGTLVDCYVVLNDNGNLIRLNYTRCNTRRRVVFINSIFGTEVHFKLFSIKRAYFMFVRLDDDSYYLLPCAHQQPQSAPETNNVSMLHKEDVFHAYFANQSQTQQTVQQRESQWTVLSDLYDVIQTVFIEHSEYESLKQVMTSPANTVHLRYHQDASKYSHVCIDEQVRRRMNVYDLIAVCYSDKHFELLGIYSDADYGNVQSSSDDDCSLQSILRILPSIKEKEKGSTSDLLLFRPWYHGIMEMDAATIQRLKCGKNHKDSEWFDIMQWQFLFLSEHFQRLHQDSSPLTAKVRYKLYQQLLASLMSHFHRMDIKKVFFWMRLIIQYLENYCFPLKIKHFESLSEFISHWHKFAHDHGGHHNIDVYPGRPQIGIDHELKSFGDEFNWIRSDYFNATCIEQLIRDYLNAKYKLSSLHCKSNENNNASSNSTNPRKRCFQEMDHDDDNNHNGKEEEKGNGDEAVCRKRRKLNDLSASTNSQQNDPDNEKKESVKEDDDGLIADPFDVQCKGLILVIQGIPGLGKTTLGEHVKNALIESKMNEKLFAQYPSRSVITIEQDTFYDEHKDEHWNRKNSGRLCQHAFEELIKSDKYGIIVLLRNNSTETQYKRYCEIGKKYGFGSIALYPYSFRSPTPQNSDFSETSANDNDNNSNKDNRQRLGDVLLLLICLQSVLKRSKCKDNKHPTFDRLSIDKQLAIVLSFYCVFQPGSVVLSKNKNHNDNSNNATLLGANELHWIRNSDDDTFVNDQNLHTVLSKLHTYTQQIRQSPWDHNAMRLKEIGDLIESLKLESVDYQKYRLSAKQIAENVVQTLSDKRFKAVSASKMQQPHVRVSYFGLFWNKNNWKASMEIMHPLMPACLSRYSFTD